MKTVTAPNMTEGTMGMMTLSNEGNRDHVASACVKMFDMLGIESVPK